MAANKVPQAIRTAKQALRKEVRTRLRALDEVTVREECSSSPRFLQAEADVLYSGGRYRSTALLALLHSGESIERLHVHGDRRAENG